MSEQKQSTGILDRIESLEREIDAIKVNFGRVIDVVTRLNKNMDATSDSINALAVSSNIVRTLLQKKGVLTEKEQNEQYSEIRDNSNRSVISEMVKNNEIVAANAVTETSIVIASVVKNAADGSEKIGDYSILEMFNPDQILEENRKLLLGSTAGSSLTLSNGKEGETLSVNVLEIYELSERAVLAEDSKQ